MPTKPAFSQRVLDAIRREAIVLAPLVFAVQQALTGTDLTDPIVWVPVAFNAFLRFFVTTPTFEVEREREQGLQVIEDAQKDAFDAGKVLGKVLGQPRSPELDELEHPGD